MRRILAFGFLGVLALAVAGVLLVPMLIPAAVYKAEISKAVEKATGRAFTIGGNVHLSVFPGIKAVVEQASLANAAGGKAPAMIEVGRLSVGLKLWPLLSHRFQISSFVLEDAAIHLEVDAAGKPNWQFDTVKPASAPGAGSAGTPSAPPRSQPRRRAHRQRPCHVRQCQDRGELSALAHRRHDLAAEPRRAFQARR